MRMQVHPLVGLAIAALVLYVVYGLLLVAMQDRILFPAPTVDRATLSAAAARAGVRELELVTADGVRIYAWHRDAGRRRVVLYGPGNGESLHYRTALYAHLAARGWDTLALSYRSYPGSEGHPSERGIEQDVRALWNHATTTLGIAPEDIVLHGISLGGGAMGTLLGDVRPGGVVLEATFADLADLARVRAPVYPVSLLLRHPFRTIARAAGADWPVLVVHGTDDRLIPIDHGRRLAAAFAGAELVEVPGAGHEWLILPGSPALAAYDAFLDRVSGAAPDSAGTP